MTTKEMFINLKNEVEKGIRTNEKRVTYMSGTKNKKTMLKKMIEKYRADAVLDYELEVISKEIFEYETKIADEMQKALDFFVIYGEETAEVKPQETAEVEEVKEIKEEMKIKIEPIYNEPDELELENVETLNHRICLIYILNIPKDNTMLEKYGFKWSILRGCWFEVVRISQVLEYIHKKFNSFENLDLESYYKLLELLKADGVERIGVEWKNHWLTIVLKEDVYKCYEETYRGHLGHRILEKYRNPIEYFTDKKRKKQ